MHAVTVQLDPELVSLLHPPHGRLEDKLREYLVVELYRRREVSSGRAAELLGMERFEFVRYASRLDIPYFDLDDQELAQEIERARGED